MAGTAVYLEAIVGADITSFRRAMQQVREDLFDVGNAGRELRTLGRDLTLQFTAPIVAMAGMSVSAAAEFDAAMRNVSAISSQVAANFATTSEEVNRLGATLRGGSTAAAEAAYQVVSAGFGVNNFAEALKVAEVAAATAEAGLADLDITARTLVTSMLAYGHETAENAGYFSDVITQTVALGVGDMSDLVNSMSTPVPGAVALGVSFDDLGATLAFLTQNAFSFQRAGTSVGNLLNKLITPTDAMKEAFRELGVASGQELIETMGGLQGAMEAIHGLVGTDPTALRALFNDDRGFRAAQTIINNIERYSRLMEDFDASLEGATGRAREQQLQSFSAQWDLMGAAINSLAIVIGTALIPTIQPVVNFIRDLALELTRANPQVLALGTAITLAGAAIPPIIWLLGAVMTPMGGIIATVGLVAAAFATDFAGIATTVDNFTAKYLPAVGQIKNAILEFFDILGQDISQPVRTATNDGEFETLDRAPITSNLVDNRRLGERIRTAIAQTWPSIEAGLNDLKNQIINYLNNLIDSIATGNFIRLARLLFPDTTVAEVILRLNEIHVKITDGLTNLINGLTDYLRNIANTLGTTDLSSTLIDFLQRVFNFPLVLEALINSFNLSENINQLAAAFVNFIANAVEFIKTQLIPSVGLISGVIGGFLLNAFAAAVSFIYENRSLILTTFTDTVRNIIDGLLTGISDGLSLTGNSSLSSIVNFFRSVIDGTIKVFINNVLPALNGFGGAVKNFIDKLGAAFSRLNNPQFIKALENIANILTTITAAAIRFLAGLVNTAALMLVPLSGLLDAIGDFISAEDAPGRLNALGDAVKSIGDIFAGFGIGAAQTVLDVLLGFGAVDVAENLRGLGEVFSELVTVSFDNIGNQIEMGVERAMANAPRNFAEAFEEFTNDFSNMLILIFAPVLAQISRSLGDTVSAAYWDSLYYDTRNERNYENLGEEIVRLISGGVRRGEPINLIDITYVDVDGVTRTYTNSIVGVMTSPDVVNNLSRAGRESLEQALILAARQGDVVLTAEDLRIMATLGFDVQNIHDQMVAAIGMAVGDTYSVEMNAVIRVNPFIHFTNDIQALIANAANGNGQPQPTSLPVPVIQGPSLPPTGQGQGGRTGIGTSGSFGSNSTSGNKSVTKNGRVVNAFADGGRFSPNNPILVGENGPEVLVPATSGVIVPMKRNDHSPVNGGSVTNVINIYATDTDKLLEDLRRRGIKLK